MRAALAVTVFVLLALAARLWWPGGEPAAAPPGGDAPAGANEAREDAAAGAMPPVVSVERPAAAAGNPVHEPARDQVAVEPGNVRVVAFDSGAPIEDASVFYPSPTFDWSALTPEQTDELAELRRTDEAAWFRRVSGELRTRADGTCTVPVGERGVSLVARAEELYGTGYLRADATEPLLLRLRVDSVLRVRVVTAGGAPAAGVKVLSVRGAGGGTGAQRMVLGTTDADGRLEYPHSQILAGDAAACRLRLAATAAGSSGASVEVDAVAPPDEVLLHLPPVGVVLVRVLGIDGEPLDPALLAADDSVRLTAHDDEQVNASGLGGSDTLRAAIGRDGTAEFPHVPLDKFVHVQLGHFGMELRAAGPTAAMPRVELTLREGENDVILTGTLTTPQGEPFASRAFTVSYRNGGGFGSRGGSTDAGGGFRCNLGGNAVDGRCTLQFRAGSSLRPGEESVELEERELVRGRNDLGSVQLMPEQTLLAGRLACEAGVTVTRVHLELHRQQDGRWSQDWNLQPEWSDDGAFSFPGSATPGERMRLVVGSGSYLPVEPIDCKVGDTGLEIPLRAAGSVNATFLVDDDVPPQLLTLFCRRTDAEPDAGAQMFERMQSRMLGEAQDGRFSKQWTGLVPGTYRLSVHCQGSAAAIAELPGLEVTAGECEDPRLDEVDLRGLVRVLEIRATAADGSPIVDGDSFVVVRGGGLQSPGYHLGRGVARIAISAPVDLIVFAAGHEAATVQAVTTSQAIPLRAAREARLQVELPLALPDGLRLELELRPKLELPSGTQVMLDTGRGMALDRLFIERLTLDEHGSGVVPVRFPGSYAISGRITGSRRIVRGFTPPEPDLPGDGVVTLQLDAKQLEAALDSRGR